MPCQCGACWCLMGVFIYFFPSQSAGLRLNGCEWRRWNFRLVPSSIHTCPRCSGSSGHPAPALGPRAVSVAAFFNEYGARTRKSVTRKGKAGACSVAHNGSSLTCRLSCHPAKLSAGLGSDRIFHGPRGFRQPFEVRDLISRASPA